MFLLNNNPILAEPMDILMELKNQLALNGVYRFNSFKEITHHIQFNCPIHKDGQELKPSCGITTNHIKYENGRTIPPGIVHCFGCGYTATLDEMISHLFGHDDFGLFGKEWLAKNFTTVTIEERKPLELPLSRGHNVITKSTDYVTEEELDGYRYTHSYMYKRKLTDRVIELFDIGYQPKFELITKDKQKKYVECITFPIRDINGNTLFIARRSVNTKFFYYPSTVVKPVYGLYELSLLTQMPSEIIICESMLNALTCWVYGKYAVALNGTGTPFQYKQLEALPCRKFISGLDPDEAGDRGFSKLKQYFKGKRLISQYLIPPKKDINDLTPEEFNNLQEIF